MGRVVLIGSISRLVDGTWFHSVSPLLWGNLRAIIQSAINSTYGNQWGALVELVTHPFSPFTAIDAAPPRPGQDGQRDDRVL